ncbi:hypothetical protein EMIT0P43_30441 [Pseudomonas jessenii]
MIHPILGLITLIGSLILVALAWLTEKATQKPLAEANQAALSSSQYANNLRNAEVIEAMGMLPSISKRWYQSHLRILEMQTLASDRAALISSTGRFVRITLLVMPSIGRRRWSRALTISVKSIKSWRQHARSRNRSSQSRNAGRPARKVLQHLVEPAPGRAAAEQLLPRRDDLFYRTQCAAGEDRAGNHHPRGDLAFNRQQRAGAEDQRLIPTPNAFMR